MKHDAKQQEQAERLATWLGVESGTSVHRRRSVGLNIAPDAGNLSTWRALAEARGMDMADIPFTFDEEEGEQMVGAFRSIGEAAQKFIGEHSSAALFAAYTLGDLACAATTIAAGIQGEQYGRILSPVASQLLNMVVLFSNPKGERPEGRNALERLLKSHNPKKHGMYFHCLGNAVNASLYTMYTLHYAVTHHQPEQAAQALFGALIFSMVLKSMFADKAEVPPLPEGVSLEDDGKSALVRATKLLMRDDIPFSTKAQHLIPLLLSKEGALECARVDSGLKVMEGLRNPNGGIMIVNAAVGYLLTALRTRCLDITQKGQEAGR